MAVDNICNNCKFWEELRIRNRGSCRRYPNVVETAPSHWCGEHMTAIKAEEPKETKKEKKNVANVQ